MRELTGHKVNGCNDALQVLVVDEPGCGGANHRYAVINDGTKAVQGGPPGKAFHYAIDFQNGPIAEVGTNGLTHEALLAIVIDRLEGFQRGAFAHRYNADALASLKSAVAALQQRTRDRLNRGVEGTHTV